MRVHLRVGAFVCVYVYVCMSVHVCVYVSRERGQVCVPPVCVCACVYVCVCLCVRVCVYVFLYAITSLLMYFVHPLRALRFVLFLQCVAMYM